MRVPPFAEDYAYCERVPCAGNVLSKSEAKDCEKLFGFRFGVEAAFFVLDSLFSPAYAPFLSSFVDLHRGMVAESMMVCIVVGWYRQSFPMRIPLSVCEFDRTHASLQFSSCETCLVVSSCSMSLFLLARFCCMRIVISYVWRYLTVF